MICAACSLDSVLEAEECFGCGKALFALTQGRVLADRYEISKPLGQGGMGKVYEAWDRVLEDRVAAKVLRPQFAREPEMARRFLLEIRLARRITHPNVCRLHEFGESEGIRCLYPKKKNKFLPLPTTTQSATTTTGGGGGSTTTTPSAKARQRDRILYLAHSGRNGDNSRERIVRSRTSRYLIRASQPSRLAQ